jgi:hypothetical protein
MFQDVQPRYTKLVTWPGLDSAMPPARPILAKAARMSTPVRGSDTQGVGRARPNAFLRQMWPAR